MLKFFKNSRFQFSLNGKHWEILFNTNDMHYFAFKEICVYKFNVVSIQKTIFLNCWYIMLIIILYYLYVLYIVCIKFQNLVPPLNFHYNLPSCCKCYLRFVNILLCVIHVNFIFAPLEIFNLCNLLAICISQ